jgi:hypothetical protein
MKALKNICNISNMAKEIWSMNNITKKSLDRHEAVPFEANVNYLLNLTL